MYPGKEEFCNYPPDCHNVISCLDFKIYFLYFMCMNVVAACMLVYYVQIWCPQKSEEGVGSFGIGVTVGILCGGWEANTGHL